MRHQLENLVVTPAEMAAIDRSAAASGIDSYGLMLKAGSAAGAAALRHYPGALRYVVLCGPGNNGGDGYIAAALLYEAGASVDVYSLGDTAALTGDAARAFSDLAYPTKPLATYVPRPGDVVIDALFGAGLARDVPAEVRDVVSAVTARDLPVIAVDLPSGLCGRMGTVRGTAFTATHTVTFMCRKPGHVLLPGRLLCGSIEVFDIGIPPRVVIAESHHLRVNSPTVWRMALPSSQPEAHKYNRGHLVVFSGGALTTGAARLSATAGLRAGAGLVTIFAPRDALATNAAHLTAIMLKEVGDVADVQAKAADPRISAFVLGPGFGDLKKARALVLALSDRPLVLDADGITAFREDPDVLFSAFREGPVRLVLTPHDGEFARLFPDLAADTELSKVERARKAAARSHAVVVMKGADTVIAAPDGRALVNENAPPWLATAGSGDVLAGIVGAHLAKGMPAFEAAAAAVWRHGEAGERAGEGMTAEDLAASIRPIGQAAS
ncbi:NAD(P)H-hydrate dehydratase [Sinorhizobium sp. BG8]|uniref:NAD(P)H-hydrate dehydratase n=1 Tax=Sinorhizobium sp. BG8 TaxID=2613773 RepID=UPI00193E3A03|nr:NAD(P)H-hydrate dehydratase [Sinorhizobium sp. BG8]QRM55515.1 NAD(P)H-hydrate dehydratase [Sinorhizobium sp. BG8]